jgi:hAT family C-terminal dimerisation region
MYLKTVTNDSIDEWQRLEDRFSILVKMAFNILSIPAMSAKCKRIFSSAKYLIIDS